MDHNPPIRIPNVPQLLKILVGHSTFGHIFISHWQNFLSLCRRPNFGTFESIAGQHILNTVTVNHIVHQKLTLKILGWQVNLMKIHLHNENPRSGYYSHVHVDCNIPILTSQANLMQNVGVWLISNSTVKHNRDDHANSSSNHPLLSYNYNNLSFKQISTFILSSR